MFANIFQLEISIQIITSLKVKSSPFYGITACMQLHVPPGWMQVGVKNFPVPPLSKLWHRPYQQSAKCLNHFIHPEHVQIDFVNRSYRTVPITIHSPHCGVWTMYGV